MSDRLPIKALPDIPDAVVKALQDKRLALVYGNGVSRLLGCWGWHELGRRLIDRCFALGLLDSGAREVLIRDSDPRRLVTVAEHLLTDNSKQSDYDEILRFATTGSEDRRKQIGPTLERLRELRTLTLTTNIDQLLDASFASQEFSDDGFKSAASGDNLERYDATLFKIHGCLRDLSTCVMTLGQYFDAYQENKALPALLKRVFGEYVVVFLGYGLGDVEVLEHLYRKGGSKSRKPIYVLKSYGTHDLATYAADSAYYRTFGATIVPYDIGTNGHDQLANIIDHWAQQLPAQARVRLSEQQEVDNILKKSDPT